MEQKLNPDWNTFSDREKVLYKKGLYCFIKWRAYRTLFVLAFLGNVVQWWISN